MTVQEILQLLQGGFTHDEIIAFTQSPAAPAPDPVPAPVPAPEPQPAPADEPAPAPVPAPAPTPAPEPAPAADQQSIADLIRANQELQLQVAKLTSTMQANAIAGSVIPGGLPTKAPEEAAADVIAQIIRPTRKKEV